MEIHHAKKVVIITEKLISEDVCELIKDSHASGYTICSVGGSRYGISPRVFNSIAHE